MSTFLLALATQDTTLKRAASTGGGEWCGPCPDCGGHDRFRMWPGKGRYWCRQCGKRGDAIQYLRDFRGLSFVEAKRALGMGPSLASRQARACAKAHRTALAAAREEYHRWQREKLITLTDRYLELLTECEVAGVGYRATRRQPDFYTEGEARHWETRLAAIYNQLAPLEWDLDVLTYGKHEEVRFCWWRGEREETERARLSA